MQYRNVSNFELLHKIITRHILDRVEYATTILNGNPSNSQRRDAEWLLEETRKFSEEIDGSGQLLYMRRIAGDYYN